MAKHYPHFSTVIIFVVCVAAVAEFSAYLHGKNGEGAMDVSGKIAYKPSAVADNTDWQKQFLAGNSLKYKSQAQAAKNPAKPPTLTDQIGRDFFTQYWQIHQAGMENDPNIVSSVSNRFADQVASAVNPVLYSQSDLKISASSNDAIISAYVKNVLAALKQFPTSDAATIANDALNGKKGASLAQIDPLIASYKKVLTAMKAMPVPATFSSYHLNLINTISTILFNAESLRKVDVDPVRGLAALSIYIQSLEQLSRALDDLQNGFTSAGIVFTGS